jgi:hypothetical protein
LQKVEAFPNVAEHVAEDVAEDELSFSGGIMALPQYKLHNAVKQPLLAAGPFPVILAPADPPQRLERLKNFLCSRKFLTTLVMLSIAAGATLLWFVLDPSHKLPNPTFLLVPAGTLAACLLLFFIIALVRIGAGTTAPETSEEELLPLPEIIRAKPVEHRRAKPTAPQVEVKFEAWSSAPFTEILEDAVIAEVFNDEMLAPDHMVVSFKVEE